MWIIIGVNKRSSEHISIYTEKTVSHDPVTGRLLGDVHYEAEEGYSEYANEAVAREVVESIRKNYKNEKNRLILSKYRLFTQRIA